MYPFLSLKDRVIDVENRNNAEYLSAAMASPSPREGI